MRHHIKFDGLRLFDIGQSVPPVQINHDEWKTPPELGGSVVDFLVRHNSRLRSMALDFIMRQHCLLFPYEDGTEASGRLEALLGSGCPVPTRDEALEGELWRFGDVLRLELVLKAPAIKLVERTSCALTVFAVTEMVRNGYRRLHALERPLTEWFFSVFMQTTQPTQIPFDVLHGHAVGCSRPTPSESVKIMRENGVFWKAEIQSLGNQYLQATVSDPKLMTLQNAALYQQLKRFFGEEA